MKEWKFLITSGLVLHLSNGKLFHSFFFYRKVKMHQESLQKHFQIVVILDSGKTKTVDVKASSLAVAERRALKRTPAAVDIHRS